MSFNPTPRWSHPFCWIFLFYGHKMRKLRTTTTMRAFSLGKHTCDTPLTISDIFFRLAEINTIFMLTSRQWCRKRKMTCQFLSYQSFLGKQCVSLGSTWTQSNVHSTTHFSVNAGWVPLEHIVREVDPKACDWQPGHKLKSSLRPVLMSKDDSESLCHLAIVKSKYFDACESDLSTGKLQETSVLFCCIYSLLTLKFTQNSWHNSQLFLFVLSALNSCPFVSSFVTWLVCMSIFTFVSPSTHPSIQIPVGSLLCAKWRF